MIRFKHDEVVYIPEKNCLGKIVSIDLTSQYYGNNGCSYNISELKGGEKIDNLILKIDENDIMSMDEYREFRLKEILGET